MKYKLNKEIKVGVLIVLGLAFLYWGINFLGGRNFFSKTKIFYAVYDQVNGLAEANWVMINGVKVGEVREISFMDIKGRVLVEFAIKNDVQIPKNSIARIYSSDVLGSKAIEIVLGESTELVKKGDTLWKIAEKYYGDGNLYKQIFEANRDVLKNPDMIKIGQKLHIP